MSAPPIVATALQGWHEALADSRGHVWRLLAITLLTALPMLLELVIASAVTVLPANLVGGTLRAGLTVLTAAAFAAMASHVYLAVADRLGRPSALRARA